MDRSQLEKIYEGLKTLDTLAALALGSGDMDKAAEAYTELLRAELSLGLELEGGRTAMNLANLHMLKGEFPEALGRTEEALDIFEKHCSTGDIGTARQMRARLLCLLGRESEGMREAEAALSLCRTDAERGRGCLVLLDCCVRVGNRMKARAAADKAVRYFEACSDNQGLMGALSARIRMFESFCQPAAAIADRVRLSALEQQKEEKF